MPGFWPEGKSANQDIFGGDVGQQIDAIWSYLSKGRKADVPDGLVRGRMELVPQHEALIYRNFIAGAGSRAIDHVAAINALTFSHDGKLLSSVADDGTLRIWDAGSGSEVAALIPPDSKNPRRTVAFSHDDHRIAAGDFFSTIVWDVASKSLAYKASGALLAISFSPAGKRLALGQPEAVVLVDASSGATQSAYSPEEAHAGGANPVALAFSADWKWYAILPDRGSLYVGKIAEIDAKQAADRARCAC